MNYGIKEIHHIGYFVNDINKALEVFKLMGYEVLGETLTDEKRNIKIQFCSLKGQTIELVESGGEGSPVYKMKQEGKPGMPYHICYEVDDIENSVMEIRKDKFAMPISDLAVSRIDGKRVIHLFNKQIGVFELIESRNEE